MRELTIFIDESGDFGPFEKHSPFYVLSLVFHDQSDDIAGHLDKIHQALVMRGLPENHAIHTGPLIRREHDYRLLDMPSRRSIFRGARRLCPHLRGDAPLVGVQQARTR